MANSGTMYKVPQKRKKKWKKAKDHQMHEIDVKKSFGQEGVKPYFPTSLIALSVLKFVNRQLDTQAFYI